MPHLIRSRRARTALLPLLLALVLTALVGGTPARAADDTGVAYGTISFPQKDNPGMKVRWFTQDWTYLGERTASGGSYSLNLPPGRYRLQFVDQRPTYETKKYAPTDISVTVQAGKAIRKNVTMKRGAFITGTLRTKGRPAKGARLVAANQAETSFETTANSKGQFAIGGLPDGKYSVFSYDKKRLYVGKSTYAGALSSGKSTNLSINLTKKAGSLRVYMFTSHNGVRKQVSGNPVVTAVSRATGQFWSEKVKGGSVVFQGLYPGKYKLVANGFGVWFGKTGAVSGAQVKAGTTEFGQFTYTKRGGWVSGVVVDGNDSSFPMKGTVVALYDASGNQLASTTSDEDGSFTLSGPLVTQDGAVVTVDPDPSGGGWMAAAEPGNYCRFAHAEVPSVPITQGSETYLDVVSLPRATDSGQPERCLPN